MATSRRSARRPVRRDYTPIILAVAVVGTLGLIAALTAFLMLSEGGPIPAASVAEQSSDAEVQAAGEVAVADPPPAVSRQPAAPNVPAESPAPGPQSNQPPRTATPAPAATQPATPSVPVRSVAAAGSAGSAGAGGNKSADLLAYVGGPGPQSLNAVLRLSDGTYLLGGGASDMDWLPDSVPVKALAGPMPSTPKPTGMTPFLLQVSADLSRPLAAWTLAPGSAASVDVIKTTSAPGAPTGDLFISGARPNAGYFVARLDGNVVDAAPTRLVYANDFGEADLADTQPWDVGSDGRVVYARGKPYSYDWFSVHRLEPNGEQGIVEHWRTHWGSKPNGDGFEWAGTPASSCPEGKVSHSGIVLKIWGRGDFRSWSREAFLEKSSDGNGGVKQGRWPLDAMFPGYYDPQTKKTVKLLDNGRGYYGYRFGGTPCANVFTIAIDRRDNAIYIGGNNKSRLPDGNPDFEPWVVAMSADGKLKWWQRLYSEEKGVSTPDQYVDGLAIDYATPLNKGGAIVVVGRAHGNNVNNFWNPSQIVHPDSPRRGFQEGFTGTHGNMHFSWIGKLGLEAGDLLACTYFAEYSEGAKHQNKPFSDPLVSHWPHFSAGWPDLNSTRFRYHTLHTDAAGNIYVGALGRRVITTRNAHMQMPSPTEHPGSRGQWSDFVRVYSPDLTRLKYSSLINGEWDWQTGEGGSPHRVTALTPTPGGLVVTGIAGTGKDTDRATGDDMPTVNVPAWAEQDRTNQTAVLGKLHFEQ